MRTSIRGGMGLGDALYVQSVARHLIEGGTSLRIHSAWPEVFSQLGPMAAVVPFSRNVEILAHYAPRKARTDTKQWEDVVLQAGLRPPIDLRLDWTVQDETIVERVRAHRRRVLVVQMPRSPMGRKDGFGAELLPDCRVLQHAIDTLKNRALIVQIGSGKPLFEFKGIDVDLTNQTSVSQLLDVASIADGFLGFCSFIVPLAESFSKPALLVWSRRGLDAGHPYIRQITPQKVLYRESSKWVIDDEPEAKLQEVVDGFLR